MLIKQQNIRSINKSRFHTPVSFSFLFASIIAPFVSTNINILFKSTTANRKKNLLKNSYIILSWFYYLNSLNAQRLDNGARFFVLPTKNQVFTLTKAPIAHKLWSKEQYKFVFYLLRVSFTSNGFVDTETPTINQGLIFALLSKKNFPLFSTNLLILKTARIFFFVKDQSYFVLF